MTVLAEEGAWRRRGGAVFPCFGDYDPPHGPGRKTEGEGATKPTMERARVRPAAGPGRRISCAVSVRSSPPSEVSFQVPEIGTTAPAHEFMQASTVPLHRAVIRGL